MKQMTEYETRKKLLNSARFVGCESELLEIFGKYDKLLHNCKNDEERKAIGALGAVEVHRLFGAAGSLEIDGKVVMQEKPIK